MSMLDTRSWFLVTGFWSPATGCWSLATGRSMLAAGWWFLEISGIEYLGQSS